MGLTLLEITTNSLQMITVPVAQKLSWNNYSSLVVDRLIFEGQCFPYYFAVSLNNKYIIGEGTKEERLENRPSGYGLVVHQPLVFRKSI